MPGAEALLLNCMDHRLVDEVTRYMGRRGLTNQYDQVILAGGVLGVVTDKFPAWAETFWQHLDLAIQLHRVRRVIALDHWDCGAYKLALGQNLASDSEAERVVHARHLAAFGELVRQRRPGLGVELLLMALDGSVETVG